MAGRGTSSVGFKLANILRERVAAGRYKDRFPTEAELIAEFMMSRYAVRSAMQRLESDGQINRQPGRGTSLVERAPDPGGWAIRTVQDLIDPLDPFVTAAERFRSLRRRPKRTE